ncbi:hypothetical protein TNCV_2050581 [Trichonephila clavipes]|nr:hypothetical protein TNCV_2050581 [Trichonephila clavipes]
MYGARGPLNSDRTTSHVVGKGTNGGRPLTISKVFFDESGSEPSQIVRSPLWSSKLRLTTGTQIVHHDENREPRSDTVS